MFRGFKIKNESFYCLCQYLSEEDRDNFFTSPLQDKKATVIELFYHIATNFLPLLNSLAWKEFGFLNCKVEEERNLLGLYIGLANAGVKVDEFYQAWMAEDIMGLIERTFETKYGKDKGWYYST